MGRSILNRCICAEHKSSPCTWEQDTRRNVYRREARGQPPKDIWLPVYVYVPKDKRSKLDPSGKKGVFVVYSETSKPYRVYIPGYRQINISRDVTFDEDATFNRSRHHHTNEIHDEEPEAPRVADMDAGNDVVSEEHGLEDHDMEAHLRRAHLAPVARYTLIRAILAITAVVK
jgi:hypothetical protein